MMARRPKLYHPGRVVEYHKGIQMNKLSFKTANIDSIVSEYIDEQVDKGINFGVGCAIIGAKLEDRGLKPSRENILLITDKIRAKLSKHLEEINSWELR